jgi:hypothetical protein
MMMEDRFQGSFGQIIIALINDYDFKAGVIVEVN